MKINLFSTKVTRNEEIDFDNKRLVYVNDLVPVTTHLYENHTLSTDQVISLFDGGYRVGILEELDFIEGQSKVTEEQLLILMEEFKRFNNEQKTDTQQGNELISQIQNIFNDYQLKIESNLKKKFDICQYSNEERVRDVSVKEKNEEFLNQLISKFGNIRFGEDLF
jgi:hypothetical protein